MPCGSLWAAKQVTERNCTLCSKSFQAVGSTKICEDFHYPCAMCGKLSFRLASRKPKGCSKECSDRMREETNLKVYGVKNVFQSKEIKKRSRDRMKERYGVEHSMQSEELRQKQQDSLFENYGVNHPLQSEKIRQKTKETVLERYGVENAAQSEVVQEKIKSTNRERYGTDWSFESEDVKKKIVESNLKKYGVSSVLSSPEVRGKGKKTLLERYGADNIAKTEHFREKMREISQNTYGVDHFFQSEEVKAKSRATMKNRYGAENAAQVPEIQERIKATNRERHGVDNVLKSDAVKAQIAVTNQMRYGVPNPTFRTILNVQDWINLEDYLERNPGKTDVELAEYFGVDTGVMMRKVRADGLSHKVERVAVTSVLENSMAEFLKGELGLQEGRDFIRGDRSIITPKELDFFFPDRGFAIEISPTPTHFYSPEVKWGSKPRDYHRQKFLACREKGVELFTIFGWHDMAKCREIIRHKLLQDTRKIGARTCEWSFEKKSHEAERFLRENHLLSFRPYRMVGYSMLRKDGELVAVAAFSRMVNDSPSVELKRLAFKKGVTVVGGASRLLKNYLENDGSDYTKVITLSDNDISSGGVYEKLGFKRVDVSPPQLNYHNWRENFYIRRTTLALQGADRLLRNFPGYEPVGLVCKCANEVHADASCLPTNDAIVKSYGFQPVYDCGFTRWELEVQQN